MNRPGDHDCVFPEVLIGEDDAAGILKEGDHVLVPCRDCGETPLDHLEWLTGRADELEWALAQAEPRRSLFHWAPTARRGQITRYGLRPKMRPTTHTDGNWKAPVICFADTPAWAWALSGGMPWTPPGAWDLWETTLDRLTEPLVLPGTDRASGIYEVRTVHRVYKRDLWYVATRVKP